MRNIYKQLEFNAPQFFENPYGIKIYIGTKDEDDWSVSIPKELVRKKIKPITLSRRPTTREKITKQITDKMREKDYVLYCITEQEALSVANEWTRFARGEKENE